MQRGSRRSQKVSTRDQHAVHLLCVRRESGGTSLIVPFNCLHPRPGESEAGFHLVQLALELATTLLLP